MDLLIVGWIVLLVCAATVPQESWSDDGRVADA